MDYFWNGGSGAFGDQSKWHDNLGNPGAPGPGDSGIFDSGSSGYTVSAAGAKVSYIRVKDGGVVLTGGFTTDDFSADGPCTLRGGAIHVTDAGLSFLFGIDLTIRGADVFAGTVSGRDNLTLAGASLHLSGPFGSALDSDNQISMSNSTVTTGFVDLQGVGSIKDSRITVKADTSLIGAGGFNIFGGFDLTDARVKADLANLQGNVTWTGGSLQTGDLTTWMASTTDTSTITFDRTSIATKSYEGTPDTGAPQLSNINLAGASWANVGAFLQHGTLSLTAGAHLTTGSFNRDPADGPGGGTLRVSGGTSQVSSLADFVSAKLGIQEGGGVDVGRDATVFGTTGGYITGAGSLLDVKGILTFWGSNKPFTIGDGGAVSAQSLELRAFELVVGAGSALTVDEEIDWSRDGEAGTITVLKGGLVSAHTLHAIGGSFDVEGGRAAFSHLFTSKFDLSIETGGVVVSRALSNLRNGTVDIGAGGVFRSAELDLVSNDIAVRGTLITDRLEIDLSAKATSITVARSGELDVGTIDALEGMIHVSGRATVHQELSLSETARLIVDKGGSVIVEGGASGGGAIVIGGDGLLHVVGPPFFDDPIEFTPGNHNATLVLDDLSNLGGVIKGFGEGDVIHIDDVAAMQARTIISHPDSDSTTLAFVVGGNKVGSIDFDGRFDKEDFRFDPATGMLTSSAPLIGNGGKNTLIGTIGDDLMKGLGGADRIESVQGNDTLFGGFGHDAFVFDTALASTSVDLIKDFVHAEDTLELHRSEFGGLKPGHPQSFVYAGHLAHDGSGLLAYNDQTGVLSFDTNGNGKGGIIEVAVLATHPHLTAVDITII